MKQNLIYRGAAVGLASLVIGSAVSTNKVYAEENQDDSQTAGQEQSVDSSNTGKVDRVVVDQTNSSSVQDNGQNDQADTTEATGADSSEHKDTIWEPAPPLARAQDTTENATSDGVVRPHAQSVAKTKGKKKNNKSVQNSNRKNNAAVRRSYASKTNSTWNKSNKQTQNSAKNNNQNVATLHQTSVQRSTRKTLPQTGTNADLELIVAGVASISLSMIGLAGVKNRKNQA